MNSPPDPLERLLREIRPLRFARAPDLQVRAEVLVLSAARARDEAIRLADPGRTAAAQQLLGGTVQTLRSAGLPAQADLLGHEVSALTSYDANTRKRLRYQSQRQRRGKQP